MHSSASGAAARMTARNRSSAARCSAERRERYASIVAGFDFTQPPGFRAARNKAREYLTKAGPRSTRSWKRRSPRRTLTRVEPPRHFRAAIGRSALTGAVEDRLDVDDRR